MPKGPRQNPIIRQQLANWYLKRVPFPPVSYVTYFSDDPLINGSVFARELRDHQLAQIRQDLLYAGFPQQVKRWNWLWARKNMGQALGMGKTALLAYICDQINKDFGQSFFCHSANWLGLYVQVQPGASTVDEIAAFALRSLCDRSRGYSIEQRLLARLRHRVAVENRSGNYPKNMAGVVWHRFLSDAWLAEKGILRQTLDSDVESTLIDSHVSPQVAKALSAGNLSAYFAVLNGSPHLYPVKHGFQSKALEILLNDIACAGQAATVAKVTLFLDDFYFVVRGLTQQKRQLLADRLRKVAVDGPFVSAQSGLYNWIAVMHTQTSHTFSPAWTAAGMNTHAPLKWDAESSVVLRGFTKDQGVVLLREYLRYQPNRLPHAPSAIHPFTEDALTAIVLATVKHDASESDQSIVPRGLMDVAHTVLDRAFDAQIQGTIDAPFVDHVVNGTPLPVQPDNDEDETADTEEARPTIPCPCGCHDEVAGDVFDVMAVICGGGSVQKAQRHYCENCNDTIVVEAGAA